MSSDSYLSGDRVVNTGNTTEAVFTGITVAAAVRTVTSVPVPFPEAIDTGPRHFHRCVSPVWSPVTGLLDRFAPCRNRSLRVPRYRTP